MTNECFIHYPSNEKAKTYKLSFGRINEPDNDIALPSIIDKT
jgi:hypothetical protein